MRERRRIIFLIGIMVISCLFVLGIAIILLYRTAFEGQRERLIETARSQARLIEAVARFDAFHQKEFHPEIDPKESETTTLNQIIDAHKHYNVSGKTGEFTLARHEGDNILFILTHGYLGLDNPITIPFDSRLAEPMRLALMGKSGTVIGPDYRGKIVLAAHEPVSILNLGIVAKIDLAEIRVPFIRAGLTAGVLAILVIAIGVVLFLGVGSPVIKHLEESEERFRLAFENAGFGMTLVGLDGRHLRVNDQLCKMVGYSRKELERLTVQDTTHKDDMNISADFIRRAISGKIDSATFEKRHIHKKGHVVWTQVSSALVRDSRGNPKYFISQVNDISKRKKAEYTLKEERDRAQRYLDIAGVMFVAIDCEGRVTMINKKGCEVLGYDEAEIIGKSWFRNFIPKRLRDVVKPVSEMLLAGKDEDGEYFENPILIKQGKERIIAWHNTILRDDKGVIIGHLSSGEDITERKVAENERRKYERIVATSNDLMALIDRNYIYQAVNDAYLKAFCKKRTEIIGHSVSDLLGRDPFERMTKGYLDRCLSGEEVHYQLWFDFPERGRRYMDVAFYPYFGDDEAVTGIVANSRDISDIKRLEDQLQQAQKMEAIGTLAGGIAHDFNNILSAIMGYSELAMHEAQKGSTLHAHLQQVLKGGHRARDLVKQILTFSRQEEMKKRPVEISAIVTEALKLLRASLPTTIEIRKSISPNLRAVMADPIQIHQVIMNLCTNAAHAMRESGGVLGIDLSKVKLDSNYTVRHPDISPGLYIKLTISDTGIGMPSEFLEKIFDPYFTTKEKSEGTGMGLSVVHGIVRGHGGAIEVTSKIGKGTCFNVLLPTIEAEEKEEMEITEAVPMGNERILFIDDEKPLIDLTQKILERLGYQVTIRSSGLEALALFKSKPDAFDLVITDMTMPNMTGDLLAKELMRIRPDIPIILCTGYSEHISEEKVKEMGIRAFLMKPLVTEDLSAIIRKILDK